MIQSPLRQYSPLDHLLLQIDQGLRTIWGEPITTGRDNPARHLPMTPLNEAERKHVAGLMRVNHSGEVCAQALYQGQALVSRDNAVYEKMQAASLEESDHLAWCQERLNELQSRTSLLNPFWYMGSLTIGAFAGLISDKWGLSFIAETEQQVVQHLQKHIQKLPGHDKKSEKILMQMCYDETAHRDEAIQQGAGELPTPIKWLMAASAKLMVTVAYWI